MTKIITAFFLVTFSFCSFADAPLAPPAERRVCNGLVTYCAYLNPLSDTVVYSVEENFKLKEKYKIKGWHRSFYFSLNGRYVVVGYPGQNLLPISVTPDQLMLSIYFNGKLKHEIRLKQLLKDMKSLEPTVSHYHWGYILHVTDNEIRLKTVEGDVSVNLDSGQVARANERQKIIRQARSEVAE